MPDTKRSLAESTLAIFAGRERVAVMYGDLTEMAATRGRFWFWTAYARTLISLGWRNPVALVAASVCTYWLGPIVWHSMRSLAYPLRHVLIAHPRTVFLFEILGNALIGLFFLVPFLMLRFGLRDRPDAAGRRNLRPDPAVFQLYSGGRSGRRTAYGVRGPDCTVFPTVAPSDDRASAGSGSAVCGRHRMVEFPAAPIVLPPARSDTNDCTTPDGVRRHGDLLRVPARSPAPPTFDRWRTCLRHPPQGCSLPSSLRLSLSSHRCCSPSPPRCRLRLRQQT